MKKILSLILLAALTMSLLTGCSSSDSDWNYIKSNGKLIIGITEFEPMNYKDENGKYTGFETEFAEAVCAKLNLTPVFQKIDWKAKETELNAKNIDCIWNGMTIDDERKANMDISVPYMKNNQVMIVKAGNEGKYTDSASLKDAVVVAEAKSAGEEVATKDSLFETAKYTPVEAQSSVLLEVKSGTADVGLIDYVMSIGSIGEGTDYSDLVLADNAGFAPEEYGIAFRKNSPETLKKVNDAIQALADDGTLEKIAEKYKLKDLLLVKAK